MKLCNVGKPQFSKGETYYTKIGIPLLSHASTGKVLAKRRVSASAYVELSDNAVNLVLFDTVVARFLKSGGMQLNSGGWFTRFTRSIIDNLLPKGHYLTTLNGGIWAFTTGCHDPATATGYVDGCIVRENGKVVGALTKGQTGKRLRLLAKSKRFVNRFIKQFMAGNVKNPDFGDCLLCQIASGTSQCRHEVLELGRARPPTPWEAADHVRSHIDEGYFVSSLLITACNAEYRGQYPMPLVALLLWFWEQGGKEVEGGKISASLMRSYSDLGQRYLRKALRSYIRKCVGAEFGGAGWQS